MRLNRRLVGLAVGVVVAGLIPAAALAGPKDAGAYTAPLNNFGQPDLEGTWTNATLTTLVRPATYGDRRILTPQEVAKIEGADAKEVAAGNAPTDPKVKTTDLPYNCGRGFSGAGCGYNAGWIDPGTTVMRVHGQPITGFITSTADGRLPPYRTGYTPAARYTLTTMKHRADNPETMTLGEQCVMSFGYSAGPVMLPLLYNNNYKIVQSRDTVGIWIEMVHDIRLIHIGAKHRTDGVRPWMGDSIGWYEGKTLVVETTGFPKAQAFLGSDENVKVTERFTRDAPGHILYEFTVDDPTVWTQPWSGAYEFSPAKGIVYEYACHEGNYALSDMLAGARADDAKEVQATAAAPAAAVVKKN
jgi:hypothetical protein